MRRADRLFQIVLMLGRGSYLPADRLANRLDVSVRTIYRDIQDLVRSGVPIEGEPGKGYRMLAGYHIPPLMFDDEELQALAFGAEVAKAWGDQAWGDAAERALHKIEAALPSRLRAAIPESRTLVPSFHISTEGARFLGTVRAATNTNRKLKLDYRDAEGNHTTRIVWPLGLVYWGSSWSVATWCELREDFRTFRLERIESLQILAVVIPKMTGRSLDDFFAGNPWD